MILCFFKQIKFQKAQSQPNRDSYKIKFLTMQLQFYNSDPIFFNYFSEIIEELNYDERTAPYMRKAYQVMKLDLKNQIILNSAIGYS